MSPAELKKEGAYFDVAIALTDTAKKQLQQFAEKLKLSPRSYLRTIKVSRTIADLDHSDTIEERQILEALQYRLKLD